MVGIFQVLFFSCSRLGIFNNLNGPCYTSACSKSESGETLRHIKPTKVREQRPLVALNLSILLQFSCSVVSNSAIPWTAACQASLSVPSSQSLLKLMPIELVMPSNHLILCRTLQSFPASGSSQMSQLFASSGQSIGVSASASVLPMNIKDWSPLGWTGWISLQSTGLSRVFSNATVQKH